MVQLFRRQNASQALRKSPSTRGLDARSTWVYQVRTMAKPRPYKSVKLTEEVYDALHDFQLQLRKAGTDRLPKELRKAAEAELTLSSIIQLLLEIADIFLKSLRRIAHG